MSQHRADFVSPSTKGALIDVYAAGSGDKGPPLVSSAHNLQASSPICKANTDGSRTCTIKFSAPVGADDFVVTAYDRAPIKGSFGSAKELGQGSTLGVNIVAGQTNPVSVTIDGLPTSLALPTALSFPADGNPHTAPLGILALDADGNVIGADPYLNPITVTLGESNGSGHIALSLNGGSPSSSVTVRQPTDLVTVEYDGGGSSSGPYYATLTASSSAAPSASSIVVPLFALSSPAPIAFTMPSQTATVTLVQQSHSGASYSLTSTTCSQIVSIVAKNPQHYTLTSTTRGVQPCTLVASDGATHLNIAVNPTTGSVPVTVPTPIVQPPLGTTKIQHVVIIVQENRSFDHLFNGFPGADTVPVGNNYGTPETLQPIDLNYFQSPQHYHVTWENSYDGGKLDGFSHAGSSNTHPDPTLAYHYVPQSETKPYWTLAQEYTLADRFFQTNTGASFAAHLYLIAGQAALVADTPVVPGVQGPTSWGCDDPAGTTVSVVGPNGSTILKGPYPCFDFQTLGDELDAKGLPWRYYTPATTTSSGIWSEYDAIRHIRFSLDWTTKVISPETQVLTDVGGSSGTLASVTWVIPTWGDSDHPGAGNTGPQWVASVVNAIGESSFWKSTAIFITWDDWGGWYDHVLPPQLDNMGLGFRVPLIVVSPYAKHGYVSHTVHEFGSILRFAEEDFGLAPMAASDARADDLLDCFDFNQSPKPYTPIPTVLHRPEDFQHLPPGPLGPETEY